MRMLKGSPGIGDGIRGPAGAHGAWYPRCAVAFRPALGASGDVTQARHTRVEVYLGGLGWVPADLADALKLADAGAPDTLQQEVNAYLLGNAEARWIAYNTPATSSSLLRQRVGRSIPPCRD